MNSWQKRISGVLGVSLLSAAVFAPSVSAWPGRTDICHNPGPNQQHIEVANASLPAHWAHGDYQGPCRPYVPPTPTPTPTPTPVPTPVPTPQPTPEVTPTPFVPAPGVSWDPECSLEAWVAGTADAACAPWQRLLVTINPGDAIYHHKVIISGVFNGTEIVDWFALDSKNIGSQGYSPAFQAGQLWVMRIEVQETGLLADVRLTPTSLGMWSFDSEDTVEGDPNFHIDYNDAVGTAQIVEITQGGAGR